MVSNFLGDVGTPQQVSSIISTSELITREGIEPQKGMNFRDAGTQLSVFLVLPRATGFRDVWNEESGVYEYEGHDSTTVERGKSVDQLAMYESGSLTENGKFFKAAHAFKGGLRTEPLQVQIYEKLDPGVWYDKGIFNCIDAKHIREDGRKVFKFYFTLADAEFYSPGDPDVAERMISATVKSDAWTRGKGRCVLCEIQTGLHFVEVGGSGIELRCDTHSGRAKKGLLG